MIENATIAAIASTATATSTIGQGEMPRRRERAGHAPGGAELECAEPAGGGRIWVPSASARHASSSWQKSAIDVKRSAGSFAIAHWMAASSRGETSGRRSRTGGGGSLMWRIATATKFSPGNGTSFVKSSYMTTPSE